ncbi:STAS/SEC14 domain-containing protein [Simiduia aestuariiviva]|uniref:STAS/SEC14 domain-containing protein n=1 Tax=Simiduia aestuariiviva TaxID=1510459 RepID=A0A839UHN4_9GAMM|nr:STAS/SEC14 domain-containing protein [Simiduia aestuariiviva]MBB3167372.1 hypothetical protein [Simiduia aestuariiviva]
MSTHGFSVGMERGADNLHIKLRAYGKLTHEDYEVITPLLDAALSNVPEESVDVLMDITEFEGWELRAAWDDVQLALAHGRHFRKIAILGVDGWQSLTAAVARWFVSGEVAFFTERSAALIWLKAQ